MRVEVKLEGAKELGEALGELKHFTAKRIAARGLMKLLQPVADMARSLAPVESPNRNAPSAIHLRDTIGVGTKLTARQKKQNRPLAKLEVYVGPGIGGKGGKGSAARHAHLVEFGTKERTQRGGRRTGAMPRRPFMRPAWDALHGMVFQNLVKSIADELQAYAKRAAVRTARLLARTR